MTPAPSAARLVWGLGIAQILAWGTSYYWPAVFMTAVAAETGWSPALIVGGLTVALGVSGLLTQGLGAWMDRWGPGRVMQAGAVLLAAGLAGLGLAQHPLTYLAAWALMGAGMACSLYDAGFATLAATLPSGAATAIARLTLLGGLASTICWPISHGLIGELGWRGACFVYAALHLGLSLPIYWRLLPKRTAPVRRSVVSAEPLTGGERGLLRLLGGILLLQTLVSGSLAVYLPGVLAATGLSLADAVAVAVWLGPAQVAARAAQTLLTARLTPLTTLALAISCTGGGLLLLVLALVFLLPIGWAVLGVLLYGAGNGLLTIARGTLPLTLFGQTRYARLLGQLAAPSLIGQAVVPLALAWALTTTPMVGLVGGLTALVAVSLLLTGLLARWIKAAPVPCPRPGETLHPPNR